MEKFQNGSKGNGLRATVHVSPGEVLYVAEPFAYTVKKQGRGLVCEYCLRATVKLLQCSQCKFAKYCGKECQTKAWLDHKRECKCLKSTKSKFDTDTVRLVGKIVFKMIRKSPCPSEELYSVPELETNFGKISKEYKKEFELFADMLQLYLKEEISDVSQLLSDVNLPELFAKVTCNRFSIVNGEMLAVAVGLYPGMSLLNHSCEPNCKIVFIGRHLHLRAIRKIQAGEELTVTYIDQLMPTVERQNQLKSKYCFECDCRLCQTCDNDERMLSGDRQASEKTKDLVSKVLELQSKKQWGESLALCRAQLERNTGLVPDKNIYQLRILDYAMDACMTLNLPEEALRYGYRTLEPYRYYTSGINASQALQMIKIGPLLGQQGKLLECMSMFQEAYGIMKIFYGREHPMTQNLIKILGC
ncbi:hypothetical protein NDU88_004748 [Pleurodeles waltl]|uniref:[histone H3]-lysine(4) N-trimethyltransferase n=1 Tax=Pleurodeles waltl TaxID=8319 RepID=A0AAV7QD65_PLEWA|nr:hypothetical protein NDU88_004748 [Pleurodeles waltl]